MGNQIKCRKAKFWIEDGVIFCRFKSGKSKQGFSEEFIQEFLVAITTLSNGRYLPLLIDLRQLNRNYAFSVVKILAKNPEIKSAVLSKSFVVNSYFMQFVLIVLKRIHDPIIQNKVFTNYDKAIAYSFETNQFFNAIN